MVSVYKVDIECLEPLGLPKIFSIITDELGKEILKGIRHNSLLTPHDPNPWLNATYLVSLKSENLVRNLRRVFARLDTSGSINFKLLHMRNIRVAERSRLVVLAARPGSIETILSEQGMAEALKGKILISLASGVTISQIAAALYPDDDVKERCFIFRATPNTAASVGASATVIGVSPNLLPKSEPLRMANLFLGLIGNTCIVPESQMDAASVVCGGTPALLALFCDAIMDGAVAGGLPRNMVETVTSQALESTAALLTAWTKPREVRKNVDWNPETTIKVLLDNLKGGVRDSIAEAVRDAILDSRSLEEKDD